MKSHKSNIYLALKHTDPIIDRLIDQPIVVEYDV